MQMITEVPPSRPAYQHAQTSDDLLAGVRHLGLMFAHSAQSMRSVLNENTGD
jgi:hypothetical protein